MVVVPRLDHLRVGRSSVSNPSGGSSFFTLVLFILGGHCVLFRVFGLWSLFSFFFATLEVVVVLGSTHLGWSSSPLPPLFYPSGGSRRPQSCPYRGGGGPGGGRPLSFTGERLS